MNGLQIFISLSAPALCLRKGRGSGEVFCREDGTQMYISSSTIVMTERERSVVCFGKKEQGKKYVKTRTIPREKA